MEAVFICIKISFKQIHHQEFRKINYKLLNIFTFRLISRLERHCISILWSNKTGVKKTEADAGGCCEEQTGSRGSVRKSKAFLSSTVSRRKITSCGSAQNAMLALLRDWGKDKRKAFLVVYLQHGDTELLRPEIQKQFVVPPTDLVLLDLRFHFKHIQM